MVLLEQAPITHSQNYNTTITTTSYATSQISSYYVQPLLIGGFTWPSHDIPVVVATVFGPGASEPVLEAMRVWNIAQKWFVKTYMGGNGVSFNFFNASKLEPTGGIVVNFTGTPLLGGTAWGTANLTYTTKSTDNGPTSIAYVECDVMVFTHTSLPNREIISLHELGHCLGLGHTALGGGITDLMDEEGDSYDGVGPPIPSTLNLYAVYLLSKANGTTNYLPSDPVVLPSNIPYTVSPPIYSNAVPEFEFDPSLFLVSALVAVAITIRRRKRDGISNRGANRVELD
jgi:hypothetical protein